MAGRKKGIVGIEAAIVLIAFVIVAAALAFVVLNMGMFTTQKSKEVMQQGLNEATSALVVDGAVLGKSTGTQIDTIYIPLKISPGQQGVDFSADKLDILVITPQGASVKVNTRNPNTTFACSNTQCSVINLTKLEAEPDNGYNATVYVIIGDSDNILEPGEKFIVVISGFNLSPYEKIYVEIRPLQGAPLIVERMAPPTLPPEGGYVSLL